MTANEQAQKKEARAYVKHPPSSLPLSSDWFAESHGWSCDWPPLLTPSFECEWCWSGTLLNLGFHLCLLKRVSIVHQWRNANRSWSNAGENAVNVSFTQSWQPRKMSECKTLQGYAMSSIYIFTILLTHKPKHSLSQPQGSSVYNTSDGGHMLQ